MGCGASSQSLAKALADGDAEVIRRYLKGGGNPNASCDGAPLLVHAAKIFDDTTIAKLLLEARAMVNIVNPAGQTPLAAAARCDNVALCNLLIDHGAKVDAVDSSSMSALLLAASEGHNRAIECLLRAGANVNASDSQGSVALRLFL